MLTVAALLGTKGSSSDPESPPLSILIGAGHAGRAADAYSYRTRGRSGSLLYRRNLSLTWMDEPGSPSAADRVRETFDEHLSVQGEKPMSAYENCDHDKLNAAA